MSLSKHGISWPRRWLFKMHFRYASANPLMGGYTDIHQIFGVSKIMISTEFYVFFLAPGNRGPLVTIGDPWFLGLPLKGQGEGERGYGREEPTFSAGRCRCRSCSWREFSHFFL